MNNLLAYAGCLHRFQINENSYVQIDIFEYDNQTERFRNVIEKPLIPSMIMKSSRCTIAGSCLLDKGLLVLLQLITSNSSVLMCLQLQSRPWLCHIVYTLSLPTFNNGSMRFLSINYLMSIFINEEQTPTGFYLIDNTREALQRNIELIPCSLLTYIYCYLQENYYWFMGTEVDANTERKLIKVYYGCSTSSSIPLVSFNTNQFVPLSLIDNIQDIHIINHKLQLKSRVILGDVIISSRDHRIFTCHNGVISHEVSLNSLATSILSYHTIENEAIFLFIKRDIQSIELFQYDQNYTLNPFLTANETADYVLIDDFLSTGWKQVLFLKNPFDSFLITDFSQIHIFQQGSHEEYRIEEKLMSMETDDVDIQSSFVLAQDILRKKIINAEFIVNEGYFQCKQIENDIRKISNKHVIADLSLNTQSEIYLPSSNSSKPALQLINTNWFVYRTNLFVYVTIKNISQTLLSAVHLFAVDKHSNRTKSFHLKSASHSSINEQTIFDLNPNLTLTLILTTSIELDKDVNLELYVLLNDQNRLFRVSSINISLDDLINSKNERIVQMKALETESMNSLLYRQAFVYLNTFFRSSVNIQSTSKFHLIEHFRQLLSNLGFTPLLNITNVYLRVSEGNLFEHAFVHLSNEDDFLADDLTVHFYAEDSTQATMLTKHLLSKLDFQSYSLIDANNSSNEQQTDRVLNVIRTELASYLDTLKQLPTIMRKVAPTSKSEAYRLLKQENVQSFQTERHRTDLLLASSIME